VRVVDLALARFGNYFAGGRRVEITGQPSRSIAFSD
jgi:hypothetical protein